MCTPVIPHSNDGRMTTKTELIATNVELHISVRRTHRIFKFELTKETALLTATADGNAHNLGVPQHRQFWTVSSNFGSQQLIFPFYGAPSSSQTEDESFLITSTTFFRIVHLIDHYYCGGDQVIIYLNQSILFNRGKFTGDYESLYANEMQCILRIKIILSNLRGSTLMTGAGSVGDIPSKFHRDSASRDLKIPSPSLIQRMTEICLLYSSSEPKLE